MGKVKTACHKVCTFVFPFDDSPLKDGHHAASPRGKSSGKSQKTKRGDWTWHSQKNEALPHIWWDKKEREKHWKTRGNLFQKYVWTFRMLEIVTVSMIINSDNTKSKLKPK